jgi:hypothetical protein
MPRCRKVRSFLVAGLLLAAHDERRLLHVDLELILVTRATAIEIRYSGPARYDRYAQPPADFEPPFPPRYAGGGPCVPREAVRDRLLSEGWGDFRDFEPRGRVVMCKRGAPQDASLT